MLAGFRSLGWAYSLGFDLRSLALLRIGLALIYLVDLLGNLGYVEAFYCDTGLIPRGDLAWLKYPGHWSAYLWLGSYPTVGLLYLIHIACVVALALGYRTRMASLLCFFMASSLQGRLEMLPGWDGEVRMLLLIGTFLPWGEYFSWDTRYKPPSAVDRPYASLATVAWRVQVAALYVGAGLLKGGPYWQDGTAVEVALHADGYATIWAERLLAWLHNLPGSLEFFNDAVPLIEILAPLLLFAPLPWMQMLGVVMLALMHWAFGICLDIDLFSFVCCICLLGYLPGSWWERLGIPSSTESCREVPRPRPWESALAAYMTGLIVASLISILPEGQGILSYRALLPIRWLGLEQRWAMFVPPPVDGGWNVLKGKTRKGEWVDLISLKRQVSEDKPRHIHAIYPNVRFYLHCNYHLRHVQRENQGRASVRQSTAHFLKRRWESLYPALEDELVRVEFVYFHRRYTPGKGYSQPIRHLIWEENF